MDVNERVANGVAWLDENGPTEWWNRIDTSILDISEPDICVLGQVFAADADLIGVSSGYLYTQTLFSEHGGLLPTGEEWAMWSQVISDSGFSYLSADWRDLGEALREAWIDALENRCMEVYA